MLEKQQPAGGCVHCSYVVKKKCAMETKKRFDHKNEYKNKKTPNPPHGSHSLLLYPSISVPVRKGRDKEGTEIIQLKWFSRRMTAKEMMFGWCKGEYATVVEYEEQGVNSGTRNMDYD